MSNQSELNGLIASNLATSANMLSNVANIQNQNRINKYNNDVNRQNMIYQNAVASANETESRIYNSPIEQLRRLTAAGVNAFTAMDMLDGGNGSSAGSAGAASSNAVASPVNMDLSALVDAMSRLDEMHFTDDQNRKNAREAMSQLTENLRAQADMQGKTIEEQQRAQRAQFGENANQRDWQSSESAAQRAWQGLENVYQRGHEENMQDWSNIFTARQNELQRGFQASESKKQRAWQGEQFEEQMKFTKEQNEENRFLQNWNADSGWSVDFGPIKVGWKHKDSMDSRYHGNMDSFLNTSVFDFFFK